MNFLLKFVKRCLFCAEAVTVSCYDSLAVEDNCVSIKGKYKVVFAAFAERIFFFLKVSCSFGLSTAVVM